ncbi:DUF4465 domain-containing protein [Geofilum rhodophaeum]|uniref:DUF4465 domain-containing protein n=1 Tax=Geofilum rhodophaeum TaxID=1965019 RepID=UPI000B5202BE|nr:DUF4465 domain-containing protein [Geofilum rhodophaeum]
MKTTTANKRSVRHSLTGRLLRSVLLALLLVAASCANNEKDIPAPGAHIKMPDNGFELEVGDTLRLSPRVSYEVDASYQWLLNNELLSTEKELLHQSRELGQLDYRFVVSTPYGSDTLVIPVSTIIWVNFQEFALNSDSLWLQMPENPSNGFSTKNLFFPSYGNQEEDWTGFALSNLSGQSFSTLPSPFSAHAPKKSDEVFMLMHQDDEASGRNFYFPDGREHQFHSISLTNSALTYQYMRTGLENFPRFGDESQTDPLDWFLVTIEGYDNLGNKTGEIPFYLADFRFENRRRNYLIEEWTVVDLRSLGAVNEIRLRLSSSRDEPTSGARLPFYLCIDNLKITG